MKYADRAAITFRHKFKRDRRKTEIRLVNYYVSFLSSVSFSFCNLLDIIGFYRRVLETG